MAIINRIFKARDKQVTKNLSGSHYNFFLQHHQRQDRQRTNSPGNNNRKFGNICQRRTNPDPVGADNMILPLMDE